MSKIRVLLVGCGRMGRNHLRVLREHPRFELFGVVDPDPSLPGVFRHLPFSRRKEWDAAIVATPAETHVAYCNALLETRCPVLVEKPIGVFRDDLPLRVYQPRLVVGHIERFNPAIRALRERLQNLGKVEEISTARIGGEPSRDGRSIVLDLAVHDLDIVRWLFGRLRVDSANVQKNEARISLCTQYGAPVTVRVDWTSKTKRRELLVTAENGDAIVDYVGQTLSIGTEQIPIEKAEPLRAELDAFAHFVDTGERNDLCPPWDGIAAVKLCEAACLAEGFV